MRYVILNILFVSVVMAGFFSDETESEKAQMIENERLCKLYRQKIDMYKQNMRNDTFAKATLKSYEKKRSYFCNHIESTIKKTVHTSRLLTTSAHKGS